MSLRRQLALKRLIDSPSLVALLVAAAYSIFAVAVWNARGREITRFVVIGRADVDPSQLPAGVALLPGHGYDGTAYYRFALDPFTRVRTAFGITLDAPAYRQQRIGYPLVVWLLSGGSRRVVPWMLVMVNILAVTAIGGLGAVFARLHGSAAAWGALAALYPGFLFSVSRDLTEPLACAFAIGAFVAMQRARHVMAGVLFACAVMTRESFLIAVFAVACAAMSSRARWITATPPAAVYAMWQVVLRERWGAWPFLTGGPGFAPPFVEYLHLLARPRPLWHEHRLPFTEAIYLGLTAIIVAMLFARRFFLMREDSRLK